mgnify:CR=1 FL=1
MSKKNEALQKAGTLGALIKIPDYIQQDSNIGKENIEQEDVILPRVRLCQSMSPERKKSNPDFIAGLEEGQFFQKTPPTIYGENLLVLPLKRYKTRIYFRGMTEGGGIICQAPDGLHGTVYGECAKCEHQKWQGQGVAPKCTEIYNYICILPDYENDLTILSLKSSSIKTARTWNLLLLRSKGPIFANLYAVNSVEEKNAKGNYFSYRIKFAVRDPDPKELGSYPTAELYAQAEKLYADLATKTVVAEPDDAEVSQAPEGSDDNVPF